MLFYISLILGFASDKKIKFKVIGAFTLKTASSNLWTKLYNVYENSNSNTPTTAISLRKLSHWQLQGMEEPFFKVYEKNRGKLKVKTTDEQSYWISSSKNLEFIPILNLLNTPNSYVVPKTDKGHFEPKDTSKTFDFETYMTTAGRINCAEPSFKLNKSHLNGETIWVNISVSCRDLSEVEGITQKTSTGWTRLYSNNSELNFHLWSIKD